MGRIKKQVDEELHSAQAGFRKGRSCSDHIFNVRRLLEYSVEKKQPVYMCMVDLKKAYDSINRAALWRILGKYRIAPKLIALLKDLHENNQMSVK